VGTGSREENASEQEALAALTARAVARRSQSHANQTRFGHSLLQLRIIRNKDRRKFKALGGFSLSGGIENTTADCFRDFLWWQFACKSDDE
jgi:hypothetical protein